MAAEILTIGTELLLGEIPDTNTAFLAARLRRLGIDLFRTTTVGDNVRRITAALQESLARAEVILTTGGLGPTVDDVTREAVATALGRDTEFHAELWEQIVERFARFGRTPGENNRQQATLPAGALPIENPVGTAPGFIVEAGGAVIISLPGVPAEMEYLFDAQVAPYLRARLGAKGVILARTVRTAGVGESWLDERIGDLERLDNPTVGVAAHPGRVDVRITAKAGSTGEAEGMIAGVEAEVRRRLGAAVYGADEDSLVSVVLSQLAARRWRLATLESGTQGALAAACSPHQTAFAGGEVRPAGEHDASLKEALRSRMDHLSAEAGLALLLKRGERKQEIHLVILTPENASEEKRTYGGPLVNAPAWSVSLALDMLRRLLS